jgi:hypothetical protein
MVCIKYYYNNIMPKYTKSKRRGGAAAVSEELGVNLDIPSWVHHMSLAKFIKPQLTGLHDDDLVFILNVQVNGHSEVYPKNITDKRDFFKEGSMCELPEHFTKYYKPFVLKENIRSNRIYAEIPKTYVGFSIHCKSGCSVEAEFSRKLSLKFIKGHIEKINTEVHPYNERSPADRGIRISRDGGQTHDMVPLGFTSDRRPYLMRDFSIDFFGGNPQDLDTKKSFFGCMYDVVELGTVNHVKNTIRTEGRLPLFANGLTLKKYMASVETLRPRTLHFKQVCALLGLYREQVLLNLNEQYPGKKSHVFINISVFSCRGVKNGPCYRRANGNLYLNNSQPNRARDMNRSGDMNRSRGRSTSRNRNNRSRYRSRNNIVMSTLDQIVNNDTP